MGDTIRLNRNDLDFIPYSLVDKAGRVFKYNGRILRLISDEKYTADIKHFLEEPWVNSLFQEGLIRTKICTDIDIDSAYLVLEHEQVSFTTFPSEWTDKMFWDACDLIIKVNIKLSQYGYMLKDSHPWNVMFHKGKPVFIDFGSIIKSDRYSAGWYNEFYKYCMFPIWLASRKWTREIAGVYRREHLIGVGLKFAEKNLVKKLFGTFSYRGFNSIADSKAFLESLDRWMKDHQPAGPKPGNWSEYDQDKNNADIMSPTSIKQRFVFEVLSKYQPKSVLDAAANKGYFSEMAARFGAAVVAFDYEDYCVDYINRLAQDRNLDISAVYMDFNLPAPPMGLGLCIPGALSRFNADMMVALGLIHHLCISQGLPVALFCRLCMQYANNGVILEYVFPEDIHVSSWKKDIPEDYTLEHISSYFREKFPNTEYSELYTDGGVKRQYVLFKR